MKILATRLSRGVTFLSKALIVQCYSDCLQLGVKVWLPLRHVPVQYIIKNIQCKYLQHHQMDEREVRKKMRLRKSKLFQSLLWGHPIC